MLSAVRPKSLSFFCKPLNSEDNVRITKVYTRTGDKGTTGLADGTRVPKNALRLESYGTLDELNAVVGVCRQHLSLLPAETCSKMDVWLEAVQNDLFNLGADLATPIGARWKQMVVVDAQDVTQLERVIDFCQEQLPPLREFVLPGGTLLNSYLHLARTVCRRAERLTVSLQLAEDINPFALPYINRLSDLLFVLSRWVQAQALAPEVTWDKNKGIRAIEVAPVAKA